MSQENSIFISVGDPSGDIAGSHLMRELKARLPSVFFRGLGGRKMEAEGQRQLVPRSELSVMGFWEVAKKFFFFRELMNETVSRIRRDKPRAIILVDYPGFNLHLAKRVRDLKIPIVYYVSPQIWAWGQKRIHDIKRLVDLMLLILPFESEIYDNAGVKNIFVGHYLLDDIDNSLIRSPYDPESDLILLMPGSRPQEIQRMLPSLLGAARILAVRQKYRFAVAAVDEEIDYEASLAAMPLPVEIVKGRARDLIAESRLVLTSSGTATLEIGIIGRPMVVIYKTGWLTFQIARRLVKVDKIALINWVAGKKIVPELIQHEASPERIASEANRFLNDDKLARETVGRLNETIASLGKPGTAARAAEAVMELIA